ncbi:hypothetical protein AB0K51_32870 [Kitasatospora sp. NPDC049285]|uniref:hypothetical protein n=1 Tax=Kitasatospora sp. NPDC049285 TaxID=3157096 RepID=UPI003447CBE7
MHPAPLETDTAWSPPDEDVRPAYQPVEVRMDDHDTWALGRINGWWQDPEGRPWCRLRLIGAAALPHWRRYDPDAILLLPTAGI